MALPKVYKESKQAERANGPRATRDESTTAGGSIWARVMGPKPTLEALEEDQGGYIDQATAASGNE